jgi:uncharacterized oxidoreductase
MTGIQVRPCCQVYADLGGAARAGDAVSGCCTGWLVSVRCGCQPVTRRANPKFTESGQGTGQQRQTARARLGHDGLRLIHKIAYDVAIYDQRQQLAELPLGWQALATPRKADARVEFLRYGEARGDYDKVVATLNAADPHGN